MTGLIKTEEEFKNKSKMEKSKTIKQIQIEQNKWKDYQDSKQSKDLSEMSYWQIISNCPIL